MHDLHCTPKAGAPRRRTHPRRCSLAAVGYREASNAARKRLEEIAVDNSAQPDAFRRDLLNIARTTLSSKILTQVGVLIFLGVCQLGQVAQTSAGPCANVLTGVHAPHHVRQCEQTM